MKYEVRGFETLQIYETFRNTTFSFYFIFYISHNFFPTPVLMSIDIKINEKSNGIKFQKTKKI